MSKPLEIFLLAMNMKEHDKPVCATFEIDEKGTMVTISSHIVEEGDRYDYELIYDTENDDIEFLYTETDDSPKVDTKSCQIYHVTKVLQLLKEMVVAMDCDMTIGSLQKIKAKWEKILGDRDEHIIDIMRTVLDNGSGKVETPYEHILIKLMQIRNTPILNFEFDQKKVDFHYKHWMEER